jgi:hypothetical protein
LVEGVSLELFVFILVLRPSDEKKPVDGLLDLGEATNRAEDLEEREGLVDNWEMGDGDGCAKDGYGRAGGPFGGLVSAVAR